MKISILFGVALVAVSLLGCNQQSSIQTSVPVVAKVQTLDDWKNALSTVYTKEAIKDGQDGTSTFDAKLQKSSSSNSAIIVEGKVDGFAKFTFLTPNPFTVNSNAYLRKSNIALVVGVPDGGLPLLILKPTFYSNRSWMFMSKLSIMVDGSIVFENDFTNEKISRNSEPGEGVVETLNLVLTDADITGLRKIQENSNVVIRLSGDKGYVTMYADKPNSKKPESDDMHMFKSQLENVLYLYDSITKAVTGHIPPR
jgi:hypothetical protein